ncbi:MAG: hypothetical protein JW901_05310 [Dehalococcoidia bacterium]|nr:hypothetical protein [Dehalococcoidia bacterium]
MIEKLMLKFGYTKLPKTKEGQIVVGPVVRKLPVRKAKIGIGDLPPGAQALVNAIESVGGEVHVTEMKVTNLCDTCRASAQECRKAIKETDSENNTLKCDQWREPGVPQ